MRRYMLDSFGVEKLRLVEEPSPEPGPGEVCIDVKALSLNYRDLMVTTGMYNPKLKLPATPLSDGAGVVSAVGAGVTRVQPGDRVMSHFVARWLDGPFRQEYVGTTLGTPGAGLAAEQAVLPADAVVPIPDGYDFAQAATLPIAALTAWSALVTVGEVQAGQTVLTLGTGGVSIFACQIGHALGAQVIVTSGSDEKLARARDVGADEGVNYRQTPEWEKRVLELTGGRGVDVTVETVGSETLNQSLVATRTGGRIGLLGAIYGRQGDVNVGLILMKRLRVEGILVDSRRAFEDLVAFIGRHRIEPVIDRRFPFEELPDALRLMQSGGHFGKIVVEVA